MTLEEGIIPDILVDERLVLPIIEEKLEKLFDNRRRNNEKDFISTLHTIQCLAACSYNFSTGMGDS